MKMEVEIISKECIKPSSPTPHRLKDHKLSRLDLYVPLSYIALVLYYPLNNQDTNLSPTDIDHVVSIRLQLLKQSLSETLSRFYTFAGKTKDDFLSIECNDEGIYFVRAQVESSLNDFLNHPHIVLINKLLPEGGKWVAEPTSVNYVAGVQVTTFACGGIAIGICVSHMIADGTAFSTFIKSWAAATHKNTEEAIHPKFDSSSLYPQNDAYPREACSSAVIASHIKLDKYVTRRFVFDASAIDNLKAKATNSGVQNPTRVEVVTSLLGKCIMAALKGKSGSDKPFILTHAVNLRRKAVPPLSESDMGNFVWSAYALSNEKEAEHGIVSQLREAITKLNGDFLSSIQGEEGWFNFLEAVKCGNENFTGAADKITFSSWCNFGFYDIDFGWGTPVWASTYDRAELTYFMNVIILMDTRMGNGVEAWVYLPEEDMAALQLDKQLVEFVSIDPSPLQIK